MNSEANNLTASFLIFHSVLYPTTLLRTELNHSHLGVELVGKILGPPDIAHRTKTCRGIGLHDNGKPFKGTAQETFRRNFKKKWIGVVILFITRRAIRVWAMLLSLVTYPPATQRFSRGRLPKTSCRIIKTPNPCDDFDLIPERCTSSPQSDVTTVVMRGGSFDIGELNRLKPPIYLVNWPEIVERNDVFYATADGLTLRNYAERGASPICYVDVSGTGEDGTPQDDPLPEELERLITTPPNFRLSLQYKLQLRTRPKLGSGLACVMALSKFARRLEVYGWDFYFTSPLSEMRSWRALQSISSGYFYTESSFFNLLYAHRLALQSNAKLHGILGDLGGHKRLAKGLEEVFYMDRP